MKNNLKSILAVILASAFAFAGCSGSNSSSTGTDSKVSEVQQESKVEDNSPFDENGRYKETVKMTMAKNMFPGAVMPAGMTADNNCVTDFLKERYNIECVVDWSAETSDYNTKLSLNIATGKIPDMVFCSDYGMFKQMAESNMLADLTEPYAKYASATMQDINKSFENRNINAVTIGGKQYAIPGSNLGYAHDMLWLRSDWLKKLKLEEPKTIADIEKVLTAFVKDDPDGNKKNDTVGLIVSATNPINGYSNRYGLEPIFAAYNTYPTQWLQDENGKVYYGSTDPKMKEALTVLRDWYKKGLIDKQFPTRIGSGETPAVWSSGQAGAHFGGWTSVYADLLANVPDSDAVAVAAPFDQKGEFTYLTPSPVNQMMVVNKDFKFPEAAIIALGANNDMYRGTFDPAKEPIMKKYADIMNKYIANNEIDTFGARTINILGNLTFDYYGIVPQLHEAVKSFVETGKYDEYSGMTDYDKSQCEISKKYADGPKDSVGYWAYYARYVGGRDLKVGKPVFASYYYNTESSAEIKPTLDKLEDQMYLQIILGEKPVEYFDEFVKQWKELGGDTLTQEVEAELAK